MEFTANMTDGVVTASDWFKGIGLSVLASVIGGASKLAIRKSWLIQEESYESLEVNSDHGSKHGDDDGTHTAVTAAATLETSSRIAPLSLDDDVSDRLSPTISSSSKNRIENLRSNHRVNSSISAAENFATRTSPPDWFPFALRYSGMFGMSVLNPICCVLAMNYASPSILAPFSGLTLVWVILFSNPALGEEPSQAQVIAASLIIVGEVIVATFGDHTNSEGVTIEDVRRGYTEPPFIAYFVGLGLYLAMLAYWMHFSESRILRRFAWGSFGGAMTGLQNFLKDSLIIIKATGPLESYPWFFYFFLAGAAISAFGGLLVLTACMKRYDATYSAASFVGSFVISASIMSAAHYNTFKFLKGLLNYILYPLGLVVLMIGVCILVRQSKDEGEEEEEEIQEGPVRKNSEDSQAAFIYNQLEDHGTPTRNERVV